MSEPPKPEAPAEEPAKAGIVQAGEIRLSTIESLRALGALGIFMAHAYALATQFDVLSVRSTGGIIAAQGAIGLTLFFSLSGYLFFWPFARSIFVKRRRLDIRQYAINRALRVLPLYVIAVTILMIWIENGGTLENWIRYATLTTNFDLASLTMDTPLWTVPVEIHFYILLPFLAIGFGAISGGRLWPSVLILLVMGSFSYWVLETQTDVVYADALGKSLIARFYAFVPGMMVALLRVHWTRSGPPQWLRGPRGRADLWLLAALVLLALNGVNWEYSIINSGLPEELPGMALLIAAFVVPQLAPGLGVRVLTWRPLAALGVVSYSFYVWHRVVLVEVAGHDRWPPVELVAVALPITIAVSFVSYKLIEEPFLRLRRGWGGGADERLGDKPRSGADSTAPAQAGGG